MTTYIRSVLSVSVRALRTYVVRDIGRLENTDLPNSELSERLYKFSRGSCITYLYG